MLHTVSNARKAASQATERGHFNARVTLEAKAARCVNCHTAVHQQWSERSHQKRISPHQSGSGSDPLLCLNHLSAQFVSACVSLCVCVCSSLSAQFRHN